MPELPLRVDDLRSVAVRKRRVLAALHQRILAAGSLKAGVRSL